MAGIGDEEKEKYRRHNAGKYGDAGEYFSDSVPIRPKPFLRHARGAIGAESEGLNPAQMESMAKEPSQSPRIKTVDEALHPDVVARRKTIVRF